MAPFLIHAPLLLTGLLLALTHLAAAQNATTNDTISPLEFYLLRCDNQFSPNPTIPSPSTPSFSYGVLSHWTPGIPSPLTTVSWPTISGMDTLPYTRFDSGRIAHIMLYSPSFRGIATVNISSESRGQKLGLLAGTLEFAGEVYPCERLYGSGMYAGTGGTNCTGDYCMRGHYCAGRYRCRQGWVPYVHDCSVHGVNTCLPLWDDE